MKKIIANLLVILVMLVFYSCSSDESTNPQVVNAPFVNSIAVNDVSNNGNGSDLEISFNKVADESLISEYRVIVVRTSDQTSFDLATAENISDNNYLKLLPDGTDKSFTLDANSTDSGGNIVAESISYVVFILTVADGVNANGANGLSPSSSSITLETVILNAPTVNDVRLNYVRTNGNGSDLRINFNKVEDESLISEYRVFLVNSDDKASFDLSVAESIETNNYTVLAPDGSNREVSFNENSTDTGGNIITESTEYVAFVLSVADGVNATGTNSLSLASDDVTVQDINFEMYVSDAGNFNNPPWQILKFDRNGENPSVFINDNLNWPQDILFRETEGVVLISNLGSNTITKHDLTTGDYIEDFATGISGPTRMKIGPDNLLYVLQWSGNGKVFRYNLDGTFVDEFTSIGVNQSIGLDWDSDGNLYVSSYGSDLVRKFSTTGEDMGIFISSNLVGPTNVWFDTNGDLLVSDYDGTAIKRFDASGNYLGDFMTGLSQSEGVAFFSDGNFYIGNGGDGSVKMFNIQGQYIKNFIPNGSGNLLTPNAVVIRVLP